MNPYPEKVFCADCNKPVRYFISFEKSSRIWNGLKCEYNKRVCRCAKCGNTVMVPGIADLNETEFDNKFREENDYILIDDIKGIITKYDVEKRPLSLALGLGEHTIENYLKGQLPSRRYSDMLKRILAHYNAMRDMLEKNREKLNDHAIKKIETKLDYYDRINSYASPIEAIAIYVLNSKYEITNMSLQKLLYYIEAFCQVLLDKRVFDNRCEAWAYGPVYPEVYEKYKSFGGERIQVEKADLSEVIEKSYRDIIDYVLSLFAIYNGVTLKDFSHAEAPWRNAHEGFGEREHCEAEITHEAITRYFEHVNEIYDLSKESGVKAYIQSLGII